MFLDTSGLLLLLHTTERGHAEASEIFEAAPFKLTHGYVIGELVALATARRFPRIRLLEFVWALQTSSEIEIVYVDRELHLAGLTLLNSRLDKTWSLCDAVSFVLLERRNIREALTTDHHFAQAGFAPLLNP